MNSEETKRMIEEMKKEKEGTNNRNYWAPPSKEEGSFTIRILPPLTPNNETKFYFTHNVHWVDGTPYECLDQTIVDKNGNTHNAETCPICAFTRKLYKTAERGDPEWKLAGELNKKARRISRVIVRGTEDEATPVFYEYGPTIFNILFHIMTETDFGNIVDGAKGRDFNLNKVGTGRRSRYETSTPAAQATPIFEDPKKLKEALTKAKDMKYNSHIEFRSADELRRALSEFLDIKEPSENFKETNKVKESAVVSEVEKEIQVEDTSEVDDDIDSILKEFQE